MAEGVGFEPTVSFTPRSISSRVAHCRTEQDAPSLRPNPNGREAKKRIADLPVGVSVTNAVNGKGTRYYKVRLGKKFTGGAPAVKLFRTLVDARAWIFGKSGAADGTDAQGVLELKRIAGASAFTFTAAQLSEAAWALSALNGVSLTDAVRFYIARNRQPGWGKRLSELIHGHVTALAEDGCGATYVKNQRFTCSVLARELNDPAISDVTPEGVREVIRRMNWKPLNRRNYIRDWGMCFRRAVRLDYISANPLDKISRPHVERTEPEIYTLDETRILLQHARSDFRELLPFLAIGLFAGVRVEEMRRMDWSMVDLEHGFISLKAAITKSGEPRDIEIMSNLRTWLQTCEPRKGPLVPPRGFRQRLATLYRAAGFRKRNALRHSFASYYLAHTGSPDKTQLALGQQTASVLFRHYRQVVRPAAAAAYWAIAPSG